ncbi:hypothetical protein V6N13_001143 [Hibiscus sabdariffa]
MSSSRSGGTYGEVDLPSECDTENLDRCCKGQDLDVKDDVWAAAVARLGLVEDPIIWGFVQTEPTEEDVWANVVARMKLVDEPVAWGYVQPGPNQSAHILEDTMTAYEPSAHMHEMKEREFDKNIVAIAEEQFTGARGRWMQVASALCRPVAPDADCGWRQLCVDLQHPALIAGGVDSMTEHDRSLQCSVTERDRACSGAA